MNPSFDMLIFDENGKLIHTKDPLRFIQRRARKPGYHLKVAAQVIDGNSIKMNLDFGNCHIILTGQPIDFFFAFACAIKGKFLQVA